MDLSTDEKIERLVRSVLDAVDARLEDVRAEVRTLADEVSSQHRVTSAAIADLERRLNRQPAVSEPQAADQGRMELATQMLLERIEAMHQRTTIATNERIAQLSSAIDELRGAGRAAPAPAPVLAAVTAPLLPAGPAPLVQAAPARITAQVPVVAPTEPAAAAPAASTAPADGIDLDQLGSLLSERLGRLHLGPDQDAAR